MRVPSGFNEIRNELSGLADGTKFDESHSVGGKTVYTEVFFGMRLMGT